MVSIVAKLLILFSMAGNEGKHSILALRFLWFSPLGDLFLFQVLMQDATLAEDKPGSPRALIKLSLENYDAAAMASTRQAPPVPAPGLNGVKNVMCLVWPREAGSNLVCITSQLSTLSGGMPPLPASHHQLHYNHYLQPLCSTIIWRRDSICVSF